MKINWESKKVSISKLKLYEKNPKVISKSEFDKLERDHELGVFKPIIINKDFTILGGNQRYKFYKKKGIKKIWVSMPDRKLTEEEEKEIVMLDSIQRGEFDYDILGKEFKFQIDDLGLNFHIPLEYDDELSNKEVAEKEWEDSGMPEYENKNLTAHKKLIINFSSDEDMAKFSELIGQKITKKTKSVWFPYKAPDKTKGTVIVDNSE